MTFPFIVYNNSLKDKGAVYSEFGYERQMAVPTLQLDLTDVEDGNALCIAATVPIKEVNFYKNGVHNAGYVNLSAFDTKVAIIKQDSFLSAIGAFSVKITLQEQGWIYNVTLGKVLEIPEKIRGTYATLRHNQKTEYSTQYSEAGIYLGRSEKRTGAESSVSFDRLPDSFINSAEFKAFAQWAKRNPYYFSPFSGELEMPEYYSYAQTETDIVSKYTGNMRRMDLALDMRSV